MTEGTSYQDASVSAALSNSRYQKTLELKLDELDKEWYSRLKTLARERLDVLLELYKYIKTQHTVGHLRHNTHGERLKLYFEKELEKRNEDEIKKSDKYGFRVDEFAKIPLHFPDLDEMFDDRKCYSSCALSSISAFASSWSLASMSSETSGEQKQGLVDTLNRSLRDNVPYRPTMLERKKKFRRKRKQVSLVNIPSVPVFPEISFQPKRSLSSTPKKMVPSQFVKTPSPIKDPSGTPTFTKACSPETDDKIRVSQEPQHRKLQSKPAKEKREVNPRWMLPGIV